MIDARRRGSRPAPQLFEQSRSGKFARRCVHQSVLFAPLEKVGWPRRLQQRLSLPCDVSPADYDQVREVLFFGAGIQHSRIRRPRTETPRLVAERKKESKALVMTVEFVHLYRRLRHAGQPRFEFLFGTWFGKWFGKRFGKWFAL